jgi:hypothetical protein
MELNLIRDRRSRQAWRALILTGEEGLVFVALMFIGMGIGMLFDKTEAGLFIGMGLGFLGMVWVRMRKARAG